MSKVTKFVCVFFLPKRQNLILESQRKTKNLRHLDFKIRAKQNTSIKSLQSVSLIMVTEEFTFLMLVSSLISHITNPIIFKRKDISIS